jgi:hypothetical protein
MNGGVVAVGVIEVDREEIMTWTMVLECYFLFLFKKVKYI